VLRGVGFVYVIIFAGILQEGRALVGPRGLSHIADYCALADKVLPNGFVRVLRVPSLFLLNSDPTMISALQWCGLVAAIALVLNLWPRLALFACWASLVSFVGVWRELSSTLNDPLMLTLPNIKIRSLTAFRRVFCPESVPLQDDGLQDGFEVGMGAHVAHH
jgi:hypothetical protein